METHADSDLVGDERHELRRNGGGAQPGLSHDNRAADDQPVALPQMLARTFSASSPRHRTENRDSLQWVTPVVGCVHTLDTTSTKPATELKVTRPTPQLRRGRIVEDMADQGRAHAGRLLAQIGNVTR